VSNIVDFAERMRRAAGREGEFNAHLDRIYAAIPLMAECIQRMRDTGLTNSEIVGVLKHAAAEIGD
jgi:hypothetical protein